MKIIPKIRKPLWNEKKIFKCKKCGKFFTGVKIFFFGVCPHCGNIKIIEDNRIRY